MRKWHQLVKKICGGITKISLVMNPALTNSAGNSIKRPAIV